MPTLKEQLLKEMNKNFGIVYVEDLSDYENSVYDKYHFQGKTVEELKKEANDKYDTAYKNENRLGDYVASLKGSDAFITESYTEIDDLTKSNVSLKEKNESLELEKKPKEAQANEYQKKIDKLKQKQDKMVADAKKSYESTEKKNSEKEKNRVEDLNVKYGQERANLKAKLSDAMMQEVKYQNHLSEITNRRYACEITLNANKPGSKLYIDMTEKIAKLDEEIKLCGERMKEIQIEMGRIQEDVNDLDEKLDDYSKMEKAEEKALNSYNKALENAKAFDKDIAKLNDPKREIDKEIEKLQNEIDSNSNTIYKNKNSINDKERACLGYAKDLARADRDIALLELKEIKQYEEINNALESHTIKITDEGIIKGLKNVKIAYQDYYNKHSKVGRFFKFIPFTSAHKDYADFSEVRSKYMELASTNRNEIDHYLDNNELTGALLETSNKVSKEFVEKTLDKGSVMDEKTYKKYPGATVTDYLRFVDDIYNKELNVFQKDMGYGLIAADKGLKLLNELGNIKREDNTKEVNDMITKISTITKSFGGMGKPNGIIDQEIENALKPENERVEIKYDLYNVAKDLYNKAKEENIKLYGNTENAVLFTNDVTFAKITVSEVEEKVESSNNIENESVKEKEVENEESEIDNSEKEELNSSVDHFLD